jgi:hypothetical protein
MIISILLGQEPYSICNEEMNTFLHSWLPPSIKYYIIFQYFLLIDNGEQHPTQVSHIQCLIISLISYALCFGPTEEKLYSLKNEKVKQGNRILTYTPR